MQVNKIKYVFVGVFVLIVFIAAVYRQENIKFIIPKGWPKPSYDFTKNKITDNGFKLGRKLFFDPLLSRDSTISCSSCHLQFTAFTHADHALSHGINGLKGIRNSPTLFNMAWNTFFMWDGGVNNMEVQPINPITNPVEMDEKLENVVVKLNKSTMYRHKFFLAFGDSMITGQYLLKALAQFTVLLESYNAKYDKYMRKEPGGDMTAQELNGLKIFRKNCSACHTEPLFTNNTLQNNGLAPDTELKDLGRMKITRNKNDSLKFKVPSLRNITVSAPYMHDGRFRNLHQVLDHYVNGITQSATLAKELKAGVSLSDQDKTDIIAFLQTLTDKEFLFDLRFRNYPD
jgi:cytochrome c peroxidase